MASNTHAPEGTYDPYQGTYDPHRDDESSGRSGDHGFYGDDGLDGFRSDDAANQQFSTFGAHAQYYGYGARVGGTYGRDTSGTYQSGGYQFGQEFGQEEAPPVLNAFATAPAYGDGGQSASAEEWNPTEESVRAPRGRHKLAKQRGGSMARSSAVLGVGMIAAVSAGGMASAQEKAPTSISMPDVSAAANKAKDGVSTLLGGGDKVTGQPLTQAAVTDADAKAGRTDSGEALRARILQQAQSQQSRAEASAQNAAVQKATQAAQAKAKKDVASQRAKAEDARLAKLAQSYKLPTSGYQLTASFGESSSLWSNGHTGQDFASPTGTPIRAIHSGTVKEAAWAGSFGYRTILKLSDGTELWFCHQSSMNVHAGQKVRTGEVIGRVGATGNVTGAHLHLEVHPGGGAAINPMPWLRSKGLTP